MKIQPTKQQREEIAKILGWKKWQDEYGLDWIWTPPDKHYIQYAQDLPNFEIHYVSNTSNKVKAAPNKKQQFNYNPAVHGYDING